MAFSPVASTTRWPSAVRLRRWLAAACVVATLASAGLAADTDGVSPYAGTDPTSDRGRGYALLMRSLFFARGGDAERAEAEVRKALALAPDSPDLLIEAADVLASIDRAAEAERLARAALDIAPTFRPAVLFLANRAAQRAFAAEEDSESRDEAVRLFERLADAGDDDPHALRMLIQLRLVGGDLDGAIAAARSFVQSRPGDLAAARMLTQLLVQSGDRAGALDVALRYVAEHPYQDDLLGFAEQMTYGLDAWGRALEILGERAPYDEYPEVQRFYGEALLRMGRAADAAAVLEIAVSADPEHVRTRYNLAKAYRAMSRLADSAAILDALVAEAPTHPGYQWFLGETREARGDGEGALASYIAALEALPAGEDRASQRDALRRAIVRLYLQADNFDLAKDWIGRVEEADAQENLESRARVAIEAGDWGTARQAARRLVESNAPGIAAALEGEIAAHEGRWTKAAERFHEAIGALGPYARRRIADVYHELGRSDLGEELLREWSRESPELPDARYLLGVYLYQLGRPGEAEPELREAFRLDPEHAPALNYLGYSLAERSDRLEEALLLVQRAVAIEPWTGAFLDSLGWVYFQMGRYDEARPPLEQAARELPQDPTILDHLGDLYLRLDEVGLALSAWDRALAAGPDDPDSIQGKIARAREVHPEDRYPERSSAGGRAPAPGGSLPR